MQDFETVDNQGNIWFVRGEGILVSFKEVDGAGIAITPSVHPRWLTIDSLNLRQTIEVDPNNSTTHYRIVITPEQLHDVPRVGSVTFSITDEEGVVPISLWSGIITERNLYS